jgi:hypothetical protein
MMFAMMCVESSHETRFETGFSALQALSKLQDPFGTWTAEEPDPCDWPSLTLLAEDLRFGVRLFPTAAVPEHGKRSQESHSAPQDQSFHLAD